jgi:hypothetical protein
MFWGQDGIYHIHLDQNGNWVTENISYGRVQRLYEEITIEDKRKAKGVYDRFERKIRWIYKNRLSDTAETKELVLDVNLKAFYLNALRQFPNSAIPRCLAPFVVNPYQVIINTADVEVGAVQVQENAVDVVVTVQNVFGNSTKEVAYLIVTAIDPVIKYTFAFYRESGWRDWKSFDNVGVDASAFMVTGYISGSGETEDHIRVKQFPYLVVHCQRTENGFSQDINGDFFPLNPSSCIVQTRWDWANSANSKRWSPEFQAYRYRRFYLPTGINDVYDTGFATIVTKNRLRGQGRVCSIKFSTEANSDLYLLGWSMVMSTNGNV